MRKLLTCTAVLLLASNIGFADDDNITVRGCLMQMGEDFILTDANGTKYEIDEMNAELKDHLGRVVEIEGEFEGRSEDDKHEARKVDAKDIKLIAADCSAFNVAGAGTATTTGTAAVETDDDADVTAGARVDSAAPASQPEGSGVVTAGTTGPTTHVSGRVDPSTGAPSTGTAGGTSVSPDATVAQTNPPDQKPFGQEQRTGEPATGTPEVTEGEARVEADIDANMGADQPGKQKTIRGCVSDSGENLILTAADGKVYRLDGEHDKLRQNIGKQVELKGEVERLGESEPRAQLEFDVDEVNFVSANCAMPSTTGAATTTGTASAGTAVATADVDRAPEVTEGQVSTDPHVRQQDEAARVEADVDADGIDVDTKVGDRASAGKKRSITGCVSMSGDHFILTEDGSGATYRLDGERDKLREHNGHKVELKGEAEQLGEASSSGAQFEFDVEELRHIAANCAAAGATTSTTGHAGHHGSLSAQGSTTTTTAGAAATTTQAGTTPPSAMPSGDSTASTTARSTTSTTSGVASPTRSETGQTVVGTGAMAAPDPPMNPPAGTARVEADQPDGKKRNVRGCVSQVGDHFMLTEEGTGATYRLDGEHDKLRKYVNQSVSLEGEAEQLGESSSSGAQFEFDVEEVTFISATCANAPAQPQGIERN